jgi:hypothetical protein
MKETCRWIGVCALALPQLALLTGCGDSSTGTSVSPRAASTSYVSNAATADIASEPEVLVDLTFEDGRSLELLEVEPGHIVVSQGGPVGTTPLPNTRSLIQLADSLPPIVGSVSRKEIRAIFAEAQERRMQRSATLHDEEKLRVMLAEASGNVAQLSTAKTVAPEPQHVKRGNMNGYDDPWFRDNFCKDWDRDANSGTRSQCYTNVTEAPYSLGMAGTGIEGWECTFLNEAYEHEALENVPALWSITKCDRDIDPTTHLCESSRTTTKKTKKIGPRLWRKFSDPGPFTYRSVNTSCKIELERNVRYSLAASGYFRPDPPPRIPIEGCNVTAIAHTKNCKNMNGTVNTSIKACANGCGSTLDRAKAAAKRSLETQFCLSGGNGCCTADVGQDFQTCGH